ncbi:ABC transporter substrate-binding protein [Pseudoroseicyclus tamaricis]|uniref:ABC transporter substrate-binding protein n=1 Tax=Pseudoroseicyclus tamaricis TaxID=2705421 RepID=A0A6B2JSM6_9RHOB|nr:ABC transporter substrate-binding protein [Pseudoroseicyclus tamaricis]NDV01228.1 ABC transporter substrate-binding protein [Pseudoroseicyclus tamaricis]
MRNTLLALALATATTVSPAQAQDMRTITDDMGREVTYPAAPERIATLHDIELTVPLLELGAPVVASHGRPGPDGAPMIRSGLLLTGHGFSPDGIVDLGQNPIDIEVLAEAAPDLILTTTWQQAEVAQLEEIAPTIVIDTQSGLRGDFEL